MKRLSFFLFLFFLWMTVRAQMLRSSGLVLYGGKNTVNYQMASPEKGLPPFDLANSRLRADFTLGAGYRWRLNCPYTGWLFDLSLSARYGRYSYGFRYLSSDVHTTYVGGEGIRNLWSASFAVFIFMTKVSSTCRYLQDWRMTSDSWKWLCNTNGV